ncbi:MAG TPA: nucleoside recognition domain-containing protein [Ignavibacteriaceae bacterium]|nr:nucleoside recognition domain-containing protein [Ignavibacteriaceae bacterium]
MLNYVWLSLLFLGLASALYIDVSDLTKNTYKNDIPLNIVLQKDGTSSKNSFNFNIKISSADYNQFFGAKDTSDIFLKSVGSFTKDKKSVQLYITTNEATPKFLQTMAKASGKADDILAHAVIISQKDSVTYLAKIYFEKISFLAMKRVTNDSINIAGTAVQIALGLIGIMAMWLGVMKVAEQAGLIKIIANWLTPITKRLFPEVPPDHPAVGAMVMNISANMLGLGNAATPFGLKAMEELDTLNPNKGTATNSMVTFLAINTAGMTIIPATAIAVRAAAGSADPTIIIATSLFGSTCATITGITVAKLFEKFPIEKNGFGSWFKSNLKFLITVVSLISILILTFATGFSSVIASAFNFLPPTFFKDLIQIISTIAIPFFIFVFIGYGAIKKVKVYEQFVEGAKEGFNIAVRIIPYLVAMLVAIAIFRAGGAMDNWLIPVLRIVTDPIGMPAEALPMALMRPLSGSGSLGVMADIIAVHGPDSFIGILVSTFFGSSETTFYVLAVYFGAVNIKNTRHALAAGLLADIAGVLGALFIVKLLFG